MAPVDLADHRAAIGDALAHPWVAGASEGRGRAALAQLGDVGALRRCVRPQAERGTEAGVVDLPAFTVLVEELALTSDFGVALAVGLHVATFTPLLARFGGEVWADLLDAALDGRALGALAFTDAGAAGSDPLGMTTTVRPGDDDGALVLSGHKVYVTNVPGADATVVFAAREGAAAFGRISALLVPTDLPGVSATARPMAVMRSAAVGDLAFHDVALSPDHVLGRPGRGLQYFVEHIGVERLMGGIWAVAVAHQCLAEAQRHTAQHHIGGVALWQNEAVRQRLASAAVRTELLSAAVERATDRAVATGRVDPYDAAVVKAATAPVMEEVIGTCLQLRGARGLEEGSDLLGMLVDFRAFSVAGGTTETMLGVVADHLEEQRPRPPRGPVTGEVVPFPHEQDRPRPDAPVPT